MCWSRFQLAYFGSTEAYPVGGILPCVRRRVASPTNREGRSSARQTHFWLSPPPRRLTAQTSKPCEARYSAKLHSGIRSQNTALYVSPWQRMTGIAPAL